MKHIRTLRRSLGAAAAVGVLTVQQAYAALPAEVNTELGNAKTDVVELGGLVLVVLIAAAAFKYMRRAM
ncbi:major capsid protein [Ectopseudomonas mendocina]|uniref:major capsid protein n=1 Tax=Ectopseudomonas mendocina TaxID=300 RepID=UPI0005AB2981|nr:major capsid protein [Pseudomonas mendocina]QTN44128.1 phage coat protein [Pseudomonas mendocina]VEE15938.1 Bacteriophage coat protein B [Pseudomonas mendocina]